MLITLTIQNYAHCLNYFLLSMDWTSQHKISRKTSNLLQSCHKSPMMIDLLYVVIKPTKTSVKCIQSSSIVDTCMSAGSQYGDNNQLKNKLVRSHIVYNKTVYIHDDVTFTIFCSGYCS